MFCHNCGQALPVGANFCSTCGARANANVFTASAVNTMYRPRMHRMMAGVCAAFALRYGWDLAATRIVTVILAIFLFPLTELAYLICWLLIPEEVPLFMQQSGVNVANPVNVPNADVQPR